MGDVQRAQCAPVSSITNSVHVHVPMHVHVGKQYVLHVFTIPVYMWNLCIYVYHVCKH
jgi:hypothetical protein